MFQASPRKTKFQKTVWHYSEKVQHTNIKTCIILVIIV